MRTCIKASSEACHLGRPVGPWRRHSLLYRTGRAIPSSSRLSYRCSFLLLIVSFCSSHCVLSAADRHTRWIIVIATSASHRSKSSKGQGFLSAWGSHESRGLLDNTLSPRLDHSFLCLVIIHNNTRLAIHLILPLDPRHDGIPIGYTNITIQSSPRTRC